MGSEKNPSRRWNRFGDNVQNFRLNTSYFLNILSCSYMLHQFCDFTDSAGSSPKHLGVRLHGERGSTSLGRAPSGVQGQSLKLKYFWSLDVKGTSLRETASFEPSHAKIRRRVWPVGEFLKKGICTARKIFAYISPICWKALFGQIYMKFCMRGHLADIINRAKFYLNQIMGFDSVGGRIFGFSIGKRSRH